MSPSQTCFGQLKVGSSSKRPLTLIVAALSLLVGMGSCSVLPDAPTPQSPTASSARHDVELGEVVVIGRPAGKAPPTDSDPTAGGSGGGGAPPGGGGGGGGGGNYGGGSSLGTSQGTAENGQLDVGDRSKMMSYKFDNGTTVVVKIEYTAATGKVEKISVTTVGLVYGTVFKPLGDGIATSNSVTKSFNFVVTFQFEGGTAQTGPLANGTLYNLRGTYNPATNGYTMSLSEYKP